jgi:cation/acetate symporter
MAGIISFDGYDGAVYLMVGLVDMFCFFYLPHICEIWEIYRSRFYGERYYSNTARTVAVICALVFLSHVAGQMRGVGLVFSKFQVDINTGLLGMIIVLFYATLGGMKGITYTQVAQYCVLIFAFMVPAIFISIQ